uniref:Uncharacterized protein n=1 Tax=Arundo donax TaxID=35708 RepID=A0A0A9EXB2_ARUDO
MCVRSNLAKPQHQSANTQSNPALESNSDLPCITHPRALKQTTAQIYSKRSREIENSTKNGG